MSWRHSLILLLGASACRGELGYGTGPEIYAEPSTHIGDSWLFSSTRINRIDLSLDEDALEILRSERGFSYPRNKVRAQGSIDGEWIGDVGVRMRGGLGSFRAFDKKPKLEIDLNIFSGERFYGLESLSLNNFALDCSGMREALAYAAYGLVGLPTSRTGFAQLFVNDQDYGIYLVLETQDDRWLRRNFVDDTGNLYDGKYVYSGYWPTLVDFGLGRDHWFDLEEGTDVGFADIALISQGVAQADESGRLDEGLWSRVEWEEVMRLARVNQWLGNDDSYAVGPNNYRVYFEPGRPLVVIPWDTDSAFPMGLDPSDGGWAIQIETGQWEDQHSALGRSCLADPACHQIWDDLGPALSAILMDGRLLTLGLQLHTLVEEGMLGDPRLECAPGEDPQEDPDLGDFNVSSDAILAYLETGEASGSSEGCSHGGRGASPGGWRFIILAAPLLWARRQRSAMQLDELCSSAQRRGTWLRLSSALSRARSARRGC